MGYQLPSSSSVGIVSVPVSRRTSMDTVSLSLSLSLSFSVLFVSGVDCWFSAGSEVPVACASDDVEAAGSEAAAPCVIGLSSSATTILETETSLRRASLFREGMVACIPSLGIAFAGGRSSILYLRAVERFGLIRRGGLQTRSQDNLRGLVFGC